jgi:hypothetical protein
MARRENMMLVLERVERGINDPHFQILENHVKKVYSLTNSVEGRGFHVKSNKVENRLRKGMVSSRKVNFSLRRFTVVLRSFDFEWLACHEKFDNRVTLSYAISSVFITDSGPTSRLVWLR